LFAEHINVMNFVILDLRMAGRPALFWGEWIEKRLVNAPQIGAQKRDELRFMNRFGAWRNFVGNGRLLQDFMISPGQKNAGRLAFHGKTTAAARIEP
jgi:hypothetical protein